LIDGRKLAKGPHHDKSRKRKIGVKIMRNLQKIITFTHIHDEKRGAE